MIVSSSNAAGSMEMADLPESRCRDCSSLGLPAEFAIARMNAGREPLRRRDPSEIFRELRLLRLVERGTARALVLARDTPDLLQQLGPRFGQVQRVGATVGGVVAPLDEPALFEL